MVSHVRAVYCLNFLHFLNKKPYLPAFYHYASSEKCEINTLLKTLIIVPSWLVGQYCLLYTVNTANWKAKEADLHQAQVDDWMRGVVENQFCVHCFHPHKVNLFNGDLNL